MGIYSRTLLMNDDDFLPTRRSLLTRLKNWDDQESWKRFFDTYGSLIYTAARKAGLTDAEAQDIVQETVIIVARKIPGFHYNPALGSFKSWLMLITRRRIEKQLKKRMSARLEIVNHSRVFAGERSDETNRTATVERIADPKGFDLEAVWSVEWEKHVRARALAVVKSKVKPKQFQMFDLYVMKEWPIMEVARALNVSRTLIYVNKHRITRLLQHEVGCLRASLEHP